MSYSNPLAAYLAGNPTPGQRKVVEHWASSHPDNKSLLQSLSQSWKDNSLKLEELPDIEIEIESEEGLVED
ncbi:MAG: hypothetical protein AAFN10_16880 [Bacteroidota bacterium]